MSFRESGGGAAGREEELARLQAISDAVPALISFIDTEFRYRMCNRAYTVWFGLDRGQIIGRTAREVLGEKAWAVLRPRMEAALAGEPQDFEIEAAYRLGGARWIHVTYTPQRCVGGEVEGFVVLVSDISARKHAEERLQCSEERFRAFVTTSSDVIYRMSADWTQMYHLDGKDFVPEQAEVSRNWLQRYIHPDDHTMVLEAIGRAIESRSIFELQHRVIRQDGSLAWTLSRAVPIFHPNGEIAEWFGTTSDVTERRRAEQSLEESEKRYRSLFDSIDEGFCVIEMLFDGDRPIDYRFLETNPAFEKHTGLHSALGRRMLEYVPEIEPSWLEKYGRVAQTGEPIRFADEYKPLKMWFDVYAFRVGEPGANKVAILFNNITERKAAEHAIRESEERFRNMSNHSPVMLWVTDASGRCMHLNERWFEFTGQTPEVGLGFGWLNAVHPDDRGPSKEKFLRAHVGREVLRLEYRLLRADGVYRWALDTASPRFSDAGEFLGYIGSVIDIQDRREVEDNLRAAMARAEQASRAKDNFLAQLSHELRTPLTPVLMTAAVLREDESLPASLREQLAMIERNVALEARLIDDLLDLTRVTRGKFTLRAEPCDSHSLLAHVVEMVRDEAREKKLQVQLDLTASHSFVEGDPTRLQQVFWNLLRNAVKFTPLGGHITVRSRDGGLASNDGHAPRMCIEVEDTGIGFPPAIGERIFEPFERGVAAGDPGYPGLGLGLAIARAIVDLHGGRIRAASAGPGKGALFVVELPASTEQQQESTGSPRASGPLSYEVEPERPMRLLVVEDHQPTMQVLTRLLSRAGHLVTSVDTIAAAREAAASATFDAVVSDVGLPDGTGVELMEHLHSTYGLRGVALSGYGMEEDIQRSARVGFSAHLVKPVDVGELRRALRRLQVD